MKKNLLFTCFMICFLVSAIKSTAQPYQKLLYSQNEWDICFINDVRHLQSPESSFSFFSGAILTFEDTVIGSNIYKKTYTWTEDSILTPNHPCFIREDTVAQQVFILSSDSSNERILYDFTLTTGDSIFLEFRYENFFGQALKSGWYYVDSTGLINTISGVRNTWYLSNPLISFQFPNLPQITWIEGLGSTISPLYIDENFDFSFIPINPLSPYVISLTKDSAAVFHDSAWAAYYSANSISLIGDSCIFIFTGGIHENEGLNMALTMQPNPVNDYSVISLSSHTVIENSDYHIFIYDVTGRKIESYLLKGNQLSNGFEWKPVNVSPGIVFVTVYNDKQLVAAGKLMVE